LRADANDRGDSGIDSHPLLTILLTRHGKTPQSEPEHYLGQHLDAPLSDDGRATAQALHDRLDGVALARVISSPLRRAMDTARIVAPAATIEPDARLIEADYGAWEGHTRDQIRGRWPELRSAWEADPAKVEPPGGESGADVARRVRSFMRSLVAWETSLQWPEEERRVLIVGHSTVNRVLLASRLGVPLRNYRRSLRQDWSNLTVLKFVSHDGAFLVLDNDVSHIRGVRGATWD
jgi:broad specificity phosphatase PhoE